jgi:uncharacterized protein
LIRVVIDTGVVVSALIKKEGTSRKAFISALDECTLLISLNTLSELAEVLNRAKFKQFFSREEQRGVLEIIGFKGEQIEVISKIAICRDPKDDMFLNLAIDGKADVILTRDPDLLVLHPFQGIQILNPADFLVWRHDA